MFFVHALLSMLDARCKIPVDCKEISARHELCHMVMKSEVWYCVFHFSFHFILFLVRNTAMKEEVQKLQHSNVNTPSI